MTSLGGVLPTVLLVGFDIKDAVARYSRGNIVINVLATVATWIVLSILGPYAPALGLVVASSTSYRSSAPPSALSSWRSPPSP